MTDIWPPFYIIKARKVGSTSQIGNKPHKRRPLCASLSLKAKKNRQIREEEETKRLVTWSRSLLTATQWNNVLWGDPLKHKCTLGWGRAGRWVVGARRRKCVFLCYEANVPNGKLKKRLEDIGISWSFTAVSNFYKNHLPPRRLPGPAGVYGQSTVTVCLLVTEYRPSSEGVQPVWKTTRWLKERLHSPFAGGKKGVCVYVCVRVW